MTELTPLEIAHQIVAMAEVSTQPRSDFDRVAVALLNVADERDDLRAKLEAAEARHEARDQHIALNNQATARMQSERDALRAQLAAALAAKEEACDWLRRFLALEPRGLERVNELAAIGREP